MLAIEQQRRPKGRKNRGRRRGNATVAVPRPATAEQVIVRMRLGYTETLSAGTSAVTSQINSPFKIPNWAMRSSDFMAYRIVAASVQISVLDAQAGTTPNNQVKAYASVLFTAANTFAPPTNAVQILEFPGSDVRPYNAANPRSQRKFHYRTKDLNALVFGNTSAAPLVENVFVACALTSSPTGTGSPQFEFNGWMDVEFRGLSPL